MLKHLIFVAASMVLVTAQDCWQTGCQPNDWAVKGCAQYGRDERGREACRDGRGVAGFRYNCCARGGGGGGGEGGEFVSFDRFSRAITANGFRAPNRDQFNNFNRYARSIGKITTTQEAAMALAQFIHESAGLTKKEEDACRVSKCPGQYTTPGCDVPGKYYYGRGYIQLSWCGWNYRPASQELFGDDRLVRDPDQVASNDQISWQTSFWFWGKNVHPRPGVQRGEFGDSTRAINGDLECRGGHSGPATRFRYYGNVRAAFGLQGPGNPAGC